MSSQYRPIKIEVECSEAEAVGFRALLPAGTLVANAFDDALDHCASWGSTSSIPEFRALVVSPLTTEEEVRRASLPS